MVKSCKMDIKDKKYMGAGEMVYRERALAIPEDLSSMFSP